MPESRDYSADYYDAFTNQVEDIKFYEKFVRPETNVLELGCGTGGNAAWLASQGWQVTGSDFSKSLPFYLGEDEPEDVRASKDPSTIPLALF